MTYKPRNRLPDLFRVPLVEPEPPKLVAPLPPVIDLLSRVQSVRLSAWRDDDDDDDPLLTEGGEIHFEVGGTLRPEDSALLAALVAKMKGGEHV